MKSLRPALLVPVLLLAAGLCFGALWQGTPDLPEGATAAPHPGLAGVELEIPSEPRRAAIAAALRRQECPSAINPLLDGLYSHACGRPARAEVRLTEAAKNDGDGTGALEDWRLLVLAESAGERGHRAVARRALGRLLAEHPASPLWSRALLRAARLAWDDGRGNPAAGDAAAALDLVEQGRRQGMVGEIDELAWEIGLATADPAVQEAAARRLLVHRPFRAEELEVAALFAPPAGSVPSTGTADGETADGQVDWAAVLSPDELLARAENLLAADLPERAETLLAAVPPRHRDLTWRLLSARALTDRGEGLTALRILTTAGATSAADSARLEWHRALAAFAAARVRRGRAPLPAEERERLRDRARRHLAAVADQRDDPRLASRALAVLFTELWDEERVDEALPLLRLRRQIDPQDLFGARPLWQAGWREFTGRNASGAVGYWAELISLYPESAFARNARYWSARAHEELGNRHRAREIYTAVATADTGDFYTRYARARLAGEPRPEPPLTAGPATAGGLPPLARDRGTPWPEHPDFARARLLSDMGLDDLARGELEAVRAGEGEGQGGEGRSDDDPARRRAALALESLILARQGDPRSSIGRIHDAFPVLGGPLQATAPAQALHLYYPLAHGDVIRRQAEARDLPSHLVFGMVRQESGFDTTAVSRAGARGLMQLMPATSREVAGRLGLPWSRQRLSEPAFNVTLGTTYFRQVLEMFDGDLELALAGYNGGPYRIKRLWRRSAGERDVFLEGLPVSESRLYVKRILMLADSYRQLYPASGGVATTGGGGGPRG